MFAELALNVGGPMCPMNTGSDLCFSLCSLFILEGKGTFILIEQHPSDFVNCATEYVISRSRISTC